MTQKKYTISERKRIRAEAARLAIKTDGVQINKLAKELIAAKRRK